MAVCVYSGGKWNTLAGKKISQNRNWQQLGDFDKMKIGDTWHKLGFAQNDIVGLPTTLQFQNGVEPTTGTKWYITPNGSGNLEGSSWENAASIDTLRIVVTKAVSGDVLYFSEGDYNFTAKLNLPEGVKLYGGFSADDLSWEKRNGFLNQSKFTGESFYFGDIDGFIIYGFNSSTSSVIRNCVFLDGYLHGNAENSFIKNCVIPDPPSDCKRTSCFFDNCRIYYFSNMFFDHENDRYILNYIKESVFFKCSFEYIIDEMFKIEAQSSASGIFVECTFKNFYSSQVSSNIGTYPEFNFELVNCNFASGVTLHRSEALNSNFAGSVISYLSIFISSEVYPTRCENSNIVNCSGGTSYIDGKNSLSWNSDNPMSGTDSASSDYVQNTITLGNDNLLTKFKDTGFAPARGVQNLGECPCPFYDPEGYKAYKSAFGDFRPMEGSVLIGAGADPEAGETDLNGVARPTPKTIGCYEPQGSVENA